MSTYLDMQTRIADDLVNDGALTTAQIKAAIQTSIKFYERKEFYFNQKINETFSTVAAQEYYTTSDNTYIPNIVMFKAATVTMNSSKSPLYPVDFASIDAVQTGTTTSLPRNYAYFGQKIRLYPFPDAVYTVGLSFIYRLTALSADGDNNAWMDDGEEMIRQSAKKRIALDTLHDDTLALRCKTLEMDAYDELLAETNRRDPVQELMVPAMLDNRTFNIYTGY